MSHTSRNKCRSIGPWVVGAAVVAAAVVGAVLLPDEATASEDFIPTVQFSASEYVVNASAGVAEITVTLSEAAGPDGVGAAVVLFVGDGETVWGLDFAPGETEFSIPVEISDLPAGSYTLTLVDAWNATLGSPSEATLTIVDDDPPPVTVDKIQFRLPGGVFQDVPMEGLYVAAGTTVDFKAIPFPPDASWPAGQPIWGGAASGTGPETTVTFDTVSASMSDAAPIWVTCGNTVSTGVVRYGPDESTLEYDWDDEEPGNLVARATYRLWVPDDDLDGRPDAPGGYAVLKLLDFEDPENTPIVERTRWPFNNGEYASQKYTILTAEIPELSGDTSPELTGSLSPRTNYRRLEQAYDDGRVFGQVEPLLSKEAMQLFKEMGGPQVVEFMLKKIEAIWVRKDISITPASPSSDSIDIVIAPGQTRTIRLTQTVLASADPGLLAAAGTAFRIKDPTVEAKVGGDTPSFTKADKEYRRALAIMVWNSLKDLSGNDGWKMPTENVIPVQAEVNKSAPGISFKVNGLDPGQVYGAINYKTVGDGATGFGSYGWVKQIDGTGAVISVVNEGATDGVDLLKKLQTINWPRLVNP